MPEKVAKGRWLVYVAAFFLPFFGIVFGLLETAKAEKVSRRRGRWCVALGVAATALICLGALAWMVWALRAGWGAGAIK